MPAAPGAFIKRLKFINPQAQRQTQIKHLFAGDDPPPAAMSAMAGKVVILV